MHNKSYSYLQTNVIIENLCTKNKKIKKKKQWYILLSGLILYLYVFQYFKITHWLCIWLI